MLNTSESLTSFSPFQSNSSSVFESLENDQDLHITQDEYDKIRPYIDEDELRELGPEARLHIIASALACHLDTGQSDESNYSQEIPYCPRIFDGWTCWNDTPIGGTAYAPCPWFVTGVDPDKIAHKECLHDGTWFKHPVSNKTWSNYTHCLDYDKLHVNNVYENVARVYEVGHLVSLCALILSLFIFFRFRSLSCTRVTIHKHLFASFIMRNSVWLLWYRTVIKSKSPASEQNQVYCVMMFIMANYFLTANYFWMFCEGFYLHTLLVVYSFSRGESKLLKWFYVFGWLGPLLPIGLYTILRATDADPIETKECWILNSKWYLLTDLPGLISLLVNLVFLINIVRVLVMKWNGSVGESGPSADSAGSLKKATRATLILIPLLGLHYLILPLKPDGESNEWTVLTYEYVTACSHSFQGLVVSLMFCFFNGEVLAVLKGSFFETNSMCGGKSVRNLRTNATTGNSHVNSQSMPSGSTTTTTVV